MKHMLMTNSMEEKLYYVLWLPLVRLHPLSLLPEMLVRNVSFKFCKIKTNCSKSGIMDDQDKADEGDGIIGRAMMRDITIRVTP